MSDFWTAALLTTWQINLGLMRTNCAAVADLASAMRRIQRLSSSRRGVVRREDNVLHVAFGQSADAVSRGASSRTRFR